MTITFRPSEFGCAALCLAWFVCTPWVGGQTIDTAMQPPNILFVLADDLGWMDTTANGSRYYETPSMERLAREGMRFTNAYSASPLCSPTRASIMTGLYPERLKFTAPAGHLPESAGDGQAQATGPPWMKAGPVRSVRKLDLDQYTIAEALKDHGYDTIFLGKWHLGKDAKYWPDQQGFDINLGGRGDPGPPGGYFNTARNTRLPKAPKGTHYNDLLTDEAIRYLGNRSDGGKPFFMCLWYFDVHAPYQGKDELIAKYRKKTDPRGKQDCPTMGAMIETLDTGLGRVLEALDAHNLTGNTIVIFFSDNGGNMYDVADGTCPTNNDPLRGGKGSIWEGGVRVPMTVRWPGRITPGAVSDAMVSSIDFYPTLLAMAGAAPKPGKPLDGVDLVPLLTGATTTLDRDTLYWHFPHENRVRSNHGASSAVRRGDWKLYRYYFGGSNGTHRHRLYNLADDLGEYSDRSAEQPDKVAELAALLDAHLERTNAVIPLRNAEYDPQAVKKHLGLAPKDWRGKRLD
jgi:arylsulfatase A-like enzyme